nr:hypothetical protein [Tanacetum cinerariifolium]
DVEEGGDEVIGGGWIGGGCGVRGDGDDGGSEWVGDGGVAVAGWPDPVTAPKKLENNMSRDVITVGSTMRIPLLYRGEYSQWRERFMNYLEEQTDGEAMINSIQNGDQPLLVIAQVSLAGNAQNAPPTLKDPNNETAKDLWDALERQMRGSEYGEQDRKAAILYEYETFKAIEGEQLLDTYLRYLQVINDLKKCGYKKDNCELNYKFLNNLQSEWKQYGTLMRQTKNLMDINIDALYNILKQNQGDVNDALGYKKKVVVVTSDPLALVAEKTKKITALLAKASNRRKFYSKPTNNNLRTSSTSQSANKKQEFVKMDDKKKAKIKDYNYYKTMMLLAKKDSDEQVLLTEDQAWMESSSDSDQEINANMIFMAQIKKVLLESDESSSSAKETTVKDILYNGRKGIGFENPRYFEKAKDLRPSLYNEKVIGLGYTLMFLIHSDEALEIKKFKRARENKIEFAYDYGNLNASFESSETAISESENQSENECLVVENECDKEKNSKVITPGMYKLSVSQSVSEISMSKTSCDSKNVDSTDIAKITRKEPKSGQNGHENGKSKQEPGIVTTREFPFNRLAVFV